MKRIDYINKQLDHLDNTIDNLKNRLASELKPPEIREILTKELNDLMIISMSCKAEIEDAFDIVEIKLRDI
jgi:hypothetical protein